MKLKGKSAVITGGGSGIGAETALLFAKEGAQVLINGRREEKLNELCEKAAKEGLKIDYITADVSVEEDCKKTVEKALDNYGKIDILFNNAGILFPGITHETETKVFDQTIRVNVRGVFIMSKFVIPSMLERKKGIIINNSSVVGLKGFVGLSAYVTSKGAITQLTRSMALEYADKGIRVNAVCPGTIHTPMVDRFFERAEDKKAAEDYIVSFHPMGRLGKNSEVAHAALFLCDENVEFMTGNMLSVDGGWIAK